MLATYPTQCVMAQPSPAQRSATTSLTEIRMRHQPYRTASDAEQRPQLRMIHPRRRAACRSTATPSTKPS